MLSLTNLSLRRGSRLLMQDVTLTVHPGRKVGLVGANGAGKSSLFALILGELQPDSGELFLIPGTTIAHVAQETPALDRSALDYVLDGDQELRAVEAELTEEGDPLRQAALHARLDAIDGYTAPSRAARLLHGLGFSSEQESLPVKTFSGGWRMRLNLAQALMCRSDLLLLDEPTNHLDLEAVIWLEEWLRAYPGTLLLISHDRDFLDGVADHIIHVEQGKAFYYSGNYSAFEVRRAERLAGQQAAFARQQREIAHIQGFVSRFGAKASKARQAQSRLKALERMERIAPAYADSPFHFDFLPAEKLPQQLLTLRDLAAGYGDAALFSGVNLSVAPGDRIGLLGVNGAGKSTLVKVIAGELAPLHGQRDGAMDLRIGYFAQHQLEQLCGDETPLQHLTRLDARAGEKVLRDFLGRFGFTGEAALQVAGVMSGGEKARLVLALLVYQRPNLLLLDEPTNHLDLDMRHALTMALQEFEGAMILVSHDRHLLTTVTDRFLLVADGKVEAFDGDLDDYRRRLAERERLELAVAEAPTAEHSAGARKDRRREEAERRQRLQPLRRELERSEARMNRLGAEKAAVEATLADPAIYEDASKGRLKELLAEQARIEAALARAEAVWLELAEQLEAATVE